MLDGGQNRTNPFAVPRDNKQAMRPFCQITLDACFLCLLHGCCNQPYWVVKSRLAEGKKSKKGGRVLLLARCAYTQQYYSMTLGEAESKRFRTARPLTEFHVNSSALNWTETGRLKANNLSILTVFRPM